MHGAPRTHNLSVGGKFDSNSPLRHHATQDTPIHNVARRI